MFACVFITAQTSSLKDRASAVTRAHCCEDCCIISSLSFVQGYEVVHNIMKEREHMSRTENKNDLRDRIMVIIILLYMYHILCCIGLNVFFNYVMSGMYCQVQ